MDENVAIIHRYSRLHNIMIQELSILIPVYNDDATRLVRSLSKQAQTISELSYEIVVFDDGSSDALMRENNAQLAALPCCRYIFVPHHPCRAAMRNDLHRQGKFEWHLMVDARLSLVYDNFLMRYLQSGVGIGEVACGGVTVDGGALSHKLYRNNLRFRYEKYEEPNHSCKIRSTHPYLSFRTTNFFYHVSVLNLVPYDERVTSYGYEDVLLGKTLCEKGIKIHHIDNPVAYTEFEDNGRYLQKVEEALQTLHQFAGELEEYSPLLKIQNLFGRLHILGVVKLYHALASPWERKVLCDKRPFLFLLKLYKLGYYASL